MPLPAHFTLGERHSVPIVQDAGWALGPLWMGAENLAPIGIWTPNCPACRKLLYQLHYPSPHIEIVPSSLMSWCYVWEQGCQHNQKQLHICVCVGFFIWKLSSLKHNQKVVKSASHLSLWSAIGAVKGIINLAVKCIVICEAHM